MLMTLVELSEYSKLSKTTLRKYLKQGMPHLRIGRCIRVRRSDFDGWVERFTASGAPEKNIDAAWDEMLAAVR